MDSLGDRMKNNYENRARHYLTRRSPVIVRVDGRAFHKLTATMTKPFDPWFIKSMQHAALEVAREMQGFKLGYVQSDEASFLITDYDELETGAWFDYNKAKVETITASTMTGYFNKCMPALYRPAVFDARAFNIPIAEIENYFLWRAKDWERNSLQMYAGAFFSHKELHGQGRADKHEMLHKIGKNWATDVSDQERNGTFLVREGDGINLRHDVPPVWANIKELLP